MLRMTEAELAVIQRRNGARPVTRLEAEPPQRKVRARPEGTDYRGVLLRQIVQAGLPRPETEYRFYPGRKWAIDIAYPDIKLAIEVEGMAHRTRERFMSDMEKYNTLTLEGWKLLRIYTRWIATEYRQVWHGINLVRQALEVVR